MRATHTDVGCEFRTHSHTHTLTRVTVCGKSINESKTVSKLEFQMSSYDANIATILMFNINNTYLVHRAPHSRHTSVGSAYTQHTHRDRYSTDTRFYVSDLLIL